MAAYVLDASALLAYLEAESGGERVEHALIEVCAISVINVAEALSTLAERGADPAVTLAKLRSLDPGLEMVSPTPEDAAEVARLRPLTRLAGLSLGDRACLTLSLRLGVPALTTDRAWTRVDHGAEVTLIRD